MNTLFFYVFALSHSPVVDVFLSHLVPMTAQSWPRWYAMQICILGWAICLNALAGSRKSVLRSGGGGGFTNFRAAWL